jgi:SAM-dependent methyltransferase
VLIEAIFYIMHNKFTIGRSVRRMFGPLERSAADLYRSLFFDIQSFAELIHEWYSDVSTILEVGCGEGALSDQLARVYPDAKITGIDVTPHVGRLFGGDRSRVVFLSQTIESYCEQTDEKADLVILCDVIHHINIIEREYVINKCHRVLKPGGRFVLKDWEKTRSFIHLLAYVSDRYITGDRIAYCTAADLRRLVETAFGPGSLAKEIRLPPWNNNIALLNYKIPIGTR